MASTLTSALGKLIDHPLECFPNSIQPLSRWRYLRAEPYSLSQLELNALQNHLFPGVRPSFIFSRPIVLHRTLTPLTHELPPCILLLIYSFCEFLADDNSFQLLYQQVDFSCAVFNYCVILFCNILTVVHLVCFSSINPILLLRLCDVGGGKAGGASGKNFFCSLVFVIPEITPLAVLISCCLFSPAL